MPGLSSVPPPADSAREPRSHMDIVRAVYEDPRAGHEAKELLLAVAYGVYEQKHNGGANPLRTARRVLGRGGIGKPRYDDLVAADAPRYELPYQAQERCNLGPGCDAPRLRPYRPRPYAPRDTPDPTLPVPAELHPKPATIVHTYPGYKPPRDWRTEDGVCGAGSHHRILEKDPRTGWITAHWFCNRHREHADRVRDQVRAQNEQAPPPIPNRGGLLPSYFSADWETVYRRYAPHWEPPTYGLCADDWPSPGEPPRPHRRLRVIGPDLETLKD